LTGDVVVDANVWASRLIQDDVHHARCLAWFRAQEGEGGMLVAPVLAIPEVAGAVMRRTGQRRLALDAIALLQDLPASRLVAVNRSLAATAARLAIKYALRGADAIYVAAALRLDLPLVSLDRQQLDRAQAVITVITPGDNL
jgi:predicted nucleic acid-binding protein